MMRYPEQARDLPGWWQSRGRARFRSKSALAQGIGVSRRTLNDYFSGRLRPENSHAVKLYELTQLACFSPDSQMPEWARHLATQVCSYVASLPVGESTSRQYAQFATRILRRLVQAGVSGPAEITVQALIQNPPGYRSRNDRRKISKKMERYALSFFGRALAAVDVWTADQRRTFVKVLKLLYPQRARGL